MERIVPLLVAALATACSLQNNDVTDCVESAECRTDFGVGHVCNADGFCELAEASPRCTKTFPENLLADPVAAADRIILGNLMDRSSLTHQARENSTELAINAANELSGIGGTLFGVVFCTIEENSDFDDLERSDAAVASARYLVETIGVPAILGPAASSDTLAVFSDLSSTGEQVVVISPSATSPSLSDLDPSDVSNENPGLLWRTAPPDSLQSAAIASDMRTPGAGRAAVVNDVAVVFEQGAYGDALASRFVADFQALGGTATQYPFDNTGGRDEATTSAGLSAAEEILFISSQFTDAIAFLDAAAASAAYDGKGIFLPDAAANQDVLTTANPARFPQVRGTRPAPLDESDLVYANFLASYSARYSDDARAFSFVANAYDAAWLIAYGASWATLQEQAMTGQNIARGLRRVSMGESIDLLPSNWTTVQNRFAAGQSINVKGASGSLDYDPATEETTGEVEIWIINGSSIEAVYKVSP